MLRAMGNTPVTREALRLAGEADCDPRTAARWLAGEAVRGRVAERLERATRTLGVARDSQRIQTREGRRGTR